MKKFFIFTALAVFMLFPESQFAQSTKKKSKKEESAGAPAEKKSESSIKEYSKVITKDDVSY